MYNTLPIPHRQVAMLKDCEITAATTTTLRLSSLMLDWFQLMPEDGWGEMKERISDNTFIDLNPTQLFGK